MPPFAIDQMTTGISADPHGYRETFERDRALLFEQPFTPALLTTLMRQASATAFVPHDVENIGKREIEAPQRLGRSISLILARPALREWIEVATGISPVRAVAGRVVQTRTDSSQALGWHNDMESDKRLLGVVVNLSESSFSGGEFQMRRCGSERPLLSHRYDRPGSMLLFEVGWHLEHRVAEITTGGPRRVYAGWFLREPEFRPAQRSNAS